MDWDLVVMAIFATTIGYQVTKVVARRVERGAEAQLFTAKLLAARPKLPGGSGDPGDARGS